MATFDHREHHSPAVVRDIRNSLLEEIKAHAAEPHLCKIAMQAVTHLQKYIQLLDEAYLQSLNKGRGGGGLKT